MTVFGLRPPRGPPLPNFVCRRSRIGPSTQHIRLWVSAGVHDPRPHLVDPAAEFVEGAAVVDHLVGPGAALVASGLAGHASPGIHLGHPAIGHEAKHRDIGIDVDDDQSRHVVAARLDQQWHVEHDDMIGRHLGLHAPGDLGAHRRMDDRR